ncbi:MAG: type II toxin-antitoxin system RelE/ParE family toxin [Hormoscilla sp. GM7CHS1pb]|nr:type II toxin-antitoxin system RelE/ParE family toxin [Hormoscilla sp. GM7CHS1pb]
MFELTFTASALDDLHYFKKSEQNLVLDSIEQQLIPEPLTVTRNRKYLRPNLLSSWQLRVGIYRVFYDVEPEEDVVIIKAVGWKEHNRLFIRGKEFKL